MMKKMGMACADPSRDQVAQRRQLWRESVQALALELSQQACSGMIPVAGVINLARGLHEVGKAGKDGRDLARRRAFVSGYLTTLGHGMDAPRRAGGESHRRALKDPTYLHNRELARGAGVRFNSRVTWERQWRALAGQFEAGASDARQLLEALSLEGRRQLKTGLVHKLQGRVDPAEDSFVGYLKGWLLPQVR